MAGADKLDAIEEVLRVFVNHLGEEKFIFHHDKQNDDGSCFTWYHDTRQEVANIQFDDEGHVIRLNCNDNYYNGQYNYNGYKFDIDISKKIKKVLKTLYEAKISFSKATD